MRRVWVGTALALIVMMVSAACGGDDDDDDGSDGSPDDTAPTATEANGDGGSDDFATDVDPCGLVTDGEIEEATGASVDEELREDTEPLVNCLYRVGEGQVSVTYLTGPSNEIEAYFELANEESEVIDGVGEKAYWQEDPNALEVLSGDEYLLVIVNVGDEDGLAAATELAQAALERLP